MQDLTVFLEEALEDGRYPDPFKLKGARLKCLWVLAVVQDSVESYLTPRQISDLLTDSLKIAVSPQAVYYALNSCKGEVIGGKTDSQTAYKLMDKGRKLLLCNQKTEKDTVLVFQAGTPFTSRNLLADNVLVKLLSPVYICDPYFGIRTLDLLSKLPKDCELFFLTQTVESEQAFVREFATFKSEFTKFNFRKYTKNEMHDRYIIDARAAWQIGHSLKDLGRKDTIVSPLGKDIRESVLELFNRRWKVATPI